MTDFRIRSDFDVDLVLQAGSDEFICKAARVSTLGAESLDSSESSGLIRFLMKNRHGCYDSETEVLTREGWKAWPDVDGTELFLTLDLETDEIVYQNASRVIHKYVDGAMIKMSMAHVDMLVTPDHNMVSAARTHQGWNYQLNPASDFLDRSHRVRLGGGLWDGELDVPNAAALIGFIAADGHVTRTAIEFNLRKQRKIDFLYSLGYEISESSPGRFRVLNLPEEIRQWAKETYDNEGNRRFPRELLNYGSHETLCALLDGYLTGDGSVSPTGKITASTVSSGLIDDLQELAVKTDGAAVETSILYDRSSAYGSQPLHRITFYRGRNSEPRIGWTPEARENQVRVVDYQGYVHCVTVPNGTLYVRRNGKPMWSGNSPFEHGQLTFRVTAPIFVWREFMRHRIGFSYNEESGRYKVLDGVFYIPPEDRPLVQVGKAGHYTFETGSNEQYTIANNNLRLAYEMAWRSYNLQLKNGIAKEVARMCLPVATYSTAYVTCNPRSLMSFLSLRTKVADSMFPSFPQWEINQVANLLEGYFGKHFPETYYAFCDLGRVSP